MHPTTTTTMCSAVQCNKGEDSPSVAVTIVFFGFGISSTTALSAFRFGISSSSTLSLFFRKIFFNIARTGIKGAVADPSSQKSHKGKRDSVSCGRHRSECEVRYVKSA